MRSPVETGYRKCLAGCGKTITRRFAICSDCEEIYGNSALIWPSWLRALWNDVQREERQWVRIGKNEISIEIRDTDSPVEEPLEDQILTKVFIERIVDSLHVSDGTIVSMISSGFSHIEISKVLGISRNTVYNALKRSVAQALRNSHDAGIP